MNFFHLSCCIFLESRAICRYLETKYKGKGVELIPKKNFKVEGLFEQGVSIEGAYFDPFAADIISEKVLKKFVLIRSSDMALYFFHLIV